MLIRTGRWSLAIAAAIAAAAVSADAAPDNPCSVAKMRAGAKAFTCLVRERSKALRGKDADEARCAQKLSESFARAEAAGACPTTADAAAALALVTSAADSVFDYLEAATATADQLRCVLAKAKYTSRYANCQATSVGKRLGGIYLGVKADFLLCEDALDAAFVNAEDSMDCATVADSPDVRDSAGGAYGYIPNVDWKTGAGSTKNGYTIRVVLPNALMSGSDLDFALVHFSSFDGANLTNADLTNTDWRMSSLAGADLSGADLSRAELYDGTSIAGAELGTANLTRLNAFSILGCPASLPAEWECRASLLVGPTADLDYVYTPSVDLSGVNLAGASLRSTTLSDANLSSALLAGAYLHRGIFTGANLTAADLSTADASIAIFANADLTGADLSGTDLTDTDFEGAILDGVTWTGATCPDGVLADPSCCSHLLDVAAVCSP